MEVDSRLTNSLARASRVLVFTGAGISTASGIRDYRGPQGLWQSQKPVYYSEFMASEEARVQYWRMRLDGWEAFSTATPNPVHHAVVGLERAGRLHMAVTQNVDGLHEKAGTTPERLVEIHGTNARVQCQSCGEIGDPRLAMGQFRETGVSPRCPCGGYLKPATISFGQSLRQEDLDRAFSAAQQADLVVALGSTLSVAPACTIPLAAAERGVPYIVINRGPTDHDRHPLLTYRLEGDVTEIFPAAVTAALE